MSNNDPNRQGLPGGLSIEDAETFAAQIKPSWEGDDDDDNEAETARPPEVAATFAAPVPAPAAPPLAPPAGAAAPSDTIIDGVPTVAVGTAAPEPPRPKPAPAAPAAPVAPIKPGKTQLGIGTGPDSEATTRPVAAVAPNKTQPLAAIPQNKTQPLAAVEPQPPSSRRKVARSASQDRPRGQDQPPLAPGRTASGARPRVTPPDAMPPRASAASAPMPEFADSESVEIPVASSPAGLILKLGAAAVALVVVVLGVRALTSGDETAPPAGSATAPAEASPAPVATAAPTPEPTPAPAATPPPEATAAATASAAPTTSVATAPLPPPKAAPPAKHPATKPAAPPPKKPSGPPASGTKKPGGGIIRDAPF